jgi:hypothetical protein
VSTIAYVTLPRYHFILISLYTLPPLPLHPLDVLMPNMVHLLQNVLLLQAMI